MSNWISVFSILPKSEKAVLFYWENQYGFKRISKGYYAEKHSVIYEDDEFL